MQEARVDIAAAATASGVDVSPDYRQTLQPYAGFVKWSGRNRDDSGFGWIDVWQVWLALPQDVRTAEQWLGEHLAPLVAAVDAELVVTTVSPAELVLDASKTNGLIIEGTRASA